MTEFAYTAVHIYAPQPSPLKPSSSSSSPRSMAHPLQSLKHKVKAVKDKVTGVQKKRQAEQDKIAQQERLELGKQLHASQLANLKLRKHIRFENERAERRARERATQEKIAARKIVELATIAHDKSNVIADLINQDRSNKETIVELKSSVEFEKECRITEQAQRETLEEELAKAQQELRAAHDDAQAQHKEAQEEIIHLRAALKASNEHSSKLNTDREALQATIATNSRALAEKDQTIIEKDIKLEKSKNVCDMIDLELDDKKEDLRCANSKIQDLTTYITDLQQERDSREAELEQAQYSLSLAMGRASKPLSLNRNLLNVWASEDCQGCLLKYSIHNRVGCQLREHREKCPTAEEAKERRGFAENKLPLPRSSLRTVSNSEDILEEDHRGEDAYDADEPGEHSYGEYNRQGAANPLGFQSDDDEQSDEEDDEDDYQHLYAEAIDEAHTQICEDGNKTLTISNGDRAIDGGAQADDEKQQVRENMTRSLQATLGISANKSQD